MNAMSTYYLSRAALCIGFATLLIISGAELWVGILAGLLTFGWFLLAPRIGRYVVRHEAGVAALHRDERAQAINNAAARNGFVVAMLAAGAVVVHAILRAQSTVPVDVLEWLMLLGIVVYSASDIWMRRRQA